MAKYNLIEKKEKEAKYRSLVNPKLMDEMEDKIIRKIFVEKKYKERNYTAKQLAVDLGTNTRYISAVVNVRFHMNYTSLINKYRIEEAMNILTDARYIGLNMEDVSAVVGFSNRQSFYAAFYKFMNMTPREYRIKHFSADAKSSKKKEKKEKEKEKQK